MLRIYSERTARYCDGVSRRSFLQLGVAGVASVGLADVLRAKAQSAEAGARPKDTAVILLWLDGGPSHLDTYDMKPDAPAEFRGIWRPIKTNVPGIEFTELFPLQAKIADKFSIIRSLYHNDGDHFGGAHRMLTGRAGANGANTPGKAPGFGAIAAKVCGRESMECRRTLRSPTHRRSACGRAISPGIIWATNTTLSKPRGTPTIQISRSTASTCRRG